MVARELGPEAGQRLATFSELLLVRDDLKGQIEALRRTMFWAMGAGLLILLAILGAVLTVAFS
jgi:hypothetical protein